MRSIDNPINRHPVNSPMLPLESSSRIEGFAKGPAVQLDQNL